MAVDHQKNVEYKILNKMTDFKFQCIESTTDEYGKLRGRFLILSIPYGQGITIGNALRRVLLSQIRGTAITAIQTSNMVHEFSTLQGIREDILEIFLNLKQVIIKRNDEKEIIGEISVTGPGIITARNIKSDQDIKIVNPNQYIATLSNDNKFNLKLKIETDIGYRLGEQRKDKIDDFLALDAVFMPVINVNYKINTDYKLTSGENSESLILEILTNGSVTPAEALNEASLYLLNCFQTLVRTPVSDKKEDIETERKKDEDQKTETILIEELQLPVRAYNCLKKVGVNSLDDLLEYSQEDIKNIKNFGKKSAIDVFNILKEKYNITLHTVNSARI
jgi:DNA-directed RNA polymerase subunit alpha